MMRRLVRILLAASLLIAVVSVILLPISYYWWVSIPYATRSTTGFFGLEGGQVHWMRQSGPGLRDVLKALPERQPGYWDVRTERGNVRYFDSNKLWLRGMRPTFRSDALALRHGPLGQRYIALPLWLTVCVFAIPPAIARRRFRRRRQRIRQGLCLACGYDVRGSGETCPECGATRPPASPETMPDAIA